MDSYRVTSTERASLTWETGMTEHRDHQRSHADSEFFTQDVFLSHSAHDTDVVRELAERLRGDGVRV